MTRAPFFFVLQARLKVAEDAAFTHVRMHINGNRCKIVGDIEKKWRYLKIKALFSWQGQGGSFCRFDGAFQSAKEKEV